MEVGYNGKFKETWLIQIGSLNFARALCELQSTLLYWWTRGWNFVTCVPGLAGSLLVSARSTGRRRGRGTFPFFYISCFSHCHLRKTQLLPFPRFFPPRDNLFAHLNLPACRQGFLPCACSPRGPFSRLLRCPHHLGNEPCSGVYALSVLPPRPLIPQPCGWTCCQQLLLLSYLWLFQASNMFTQLSISNSLLRMSFLFSQLDND